MPRRRDANAPAPKPGYGFADVLALTGASRSNLIHWTNTQIIEAEIEGTTGRGVHRRFSTFNVIETELCAVLNRLRLPADALRAAVYTLARFHQGAVALDEEMTHAPLLAQTHEARRQRARAFIEEQRLYARDQADAADVAVYAQELAKAWAWVRSGPLSHGDPDASWSHFLGLFLTGAYADREHAAAFVALDPDLGRVLEGTAIVIDLANVVFRVGERCKRLGCPLAEW